LSVANVANFIIAHVTSIKHHHSNIVTAAEVGNVRSRQHGPTAHQPKRCEDKMVNIALLKKTNANRWRDMRVTAGLMTVIDKTASRLVDPDAKAKYVAVSNKTSIPWFVIAVIHEREASQSWKANLAQGDPWNRVSVHVPKGRGPFKSWEDAAVDALANCAPHAAQWKDWTAGGTFTLLEEYNGLGYAALGRPSPYVWASTDQYSRGKYIADGHYDPNAIDHQLGCAALLNRMAQMDATIGFVDTDDIGDQFQSEAA
jgi:lysozyme family protein